MAKPTPEQLRRLENLEAMLQRGTIKPENFEEARQNILGEKSPRKLTLLLGFTIVFCIGFFFIMILGGILTPAGKRIEIVAEPQYKTKKASQTATKTPEEADRDARMKADEEMLRTLKKQELREKALQETKPNTTENVLDDPSRTLEKTNSTSNYNTPYQSAKSTVYTTSYGTKYHLMSCKHIKRSGTATTKEDAMKSGFSACSDCNP